MQSTSATLATSSASGNPHSDGNVEKSAEFCCGCRKFHKGVTAHRGNSAHWPENSVQSFLSAIDLAVDWCECDVFLTKDGQVVVTHDPTTGRLCQVDTVIASTDYADLLDLDFAHSFRQTHGLDLVQCPVMSLPLLGDILRLFIRAHETTKLSQSDWESPALGPYTRLSIQPKDACAIKALVAVVDSLDAWAYIGFNELDLNLLLMAQSLSAAALMESHLRRNSRDKITASAIPIFYDTFGKDTHLRIAEAVEHGFGTIVVKACELCVQDVEMMHKSGLHVGVWTVNDHAEMTKLLSMGVDRIYTDDPQMLIQLHAAHDEQPVGDSTGTTGMAK